MCLGSRPHVPWVQSACALGPVHMCLKVQGTCALRSRAHTCIQVHILKSTLRIINRHIADDQLRVDLIENRIETIELFGEEYNPNDGEWRRSQVCHGKPDNFLIVVQLVR